jgi:radical SAM protein with 4Fe4S-binding SPASM domain
MSLRPKLSFLAASRLSRPTSSRVAEAEAFYRSVRPWLLVRDEDAVLIVPPNRVYKLGGSASPLLAWLDSGGSLAALPGSDGKAGLDEGRAAELLAFFEELRAAYEGRAPATGGFGRTAYDFDFTRLPVLGEAALTYRCNERCRFCYAGCGGAPCAPGPSGDASLPRADGTGEGELPTEEWKRIIRVFKEEAKIPFFSFTGGEPLLRIDLEELASYARELGLRVNLITNGSLATPERAASLKAAGIDTAQVSLESPDAEIHDALCGVDGAWERTVAGIRALREAGVSVQTNSTLTAQNRESLLRLPAFLASLGVQRFSMNLFIPAGRGLGADELFVSYSEAGQAVDALRRAAHEAGRTFFWYSPTPYCIYNPVARGLGNKSCAAVDGLVHVNPSGEILPCSSWPESLGSLREKSFAELWFSDRASYYKRKRFAPAECADCGSFVACQGACPLYWKYAGVKELQGRGLKELQGRGLRELQGRGLGELESKRPVNAEGAARG